MAAITGQDYKDAVDTQINGGYIWVLVNMAGDLKRGGVDLESVNSQLLNKRFVEVQEQVNGVFALSGEPEREVFVPPFIGTTKEALRKLATMTGEQIGKAMHVDAPEKKS